MKRKLYILIFCILGIFSCKTAKHIVHKFDTDDQSRKVEGIFYALPKTIIQIELKIKKIIIHQPKICQLKKAKLSSYQLLTIGIEKPKCSAFNEANKFQIVKYGLGDAVISTRQVPDPEEIYIVDLNSSFFEDKTINALFTESGLLTSSSSDISNKTTRYTINTIKSIASVYKATQGLPISGSPSSSLNGQLPNLSAGNVQNSFINDIIKIGPQNPTQDDVYQQQYVNALITRLLELRAAKKQLASKPGRANKETLELAFSKLESMESELMKYFTGNKELEEATAKLELEPPKCSSELCNDSEDIFLYDANSGVKIIPNSKVNYLLFPKAYKNNSDATTPVKIYWSANRKIANAIANKRIKNSGASGIYYKIPTLSSISLSYKQKNLSFSNIIISQFGSTTYLPSTTNSSDSAFDIEFYSNYGTLKKAKVVSKAIDSETAGKLTEATSTLYEAERKRQSALRSDLNQKRAQIEKYILSEKERKLSNIELDRKILEENKKIEDLEN